MQTGMSLSEVFIHKSVTYVQKYQQCASVQQRQVEDKAFFKEHGGRIMESQGVASWTVDFPRCALVLVFARIALQAACMLTFQVLEACRASESVLSCRCVYFGGFANCMTS